MSAVERALIWILRIAVWIVAFLLGQWLAAQIHWAPVISPQFWLWKLLAMVVVFVVIMLALDRIWKRETASKWTVREYVDAAIIGFFIGAVVAR
jgi:hypothetical protein